MITYKAETIGIVWNGYIEKNVGESEVLALKLISILYWWLMLVLASVGVYKILKDRKLKLFHPVLVVPAFFFIFPILTVGQDRYHLPINPFWLCLQLMPYNNFFSHVQPKLLYK